MSTGGAAMMLQVDDAIRFLVDWVQRPHTHHPGYSNYGYDIYIPNVVREYRREIEHDPSQDPSLGPRAKHVSSVFLDAAWELCRRGILRPGTKDKDGQTTKDGGYSVTFAGRNWIERSDELSFVPTEPNRFAQIISKFRNRLGDGFHQRSQESAKCHFAGAYIACCAMAGAAAESVMLSIAVAKAGDEDEILREYRSSRGRSKIEARITSGLSDPLASQFRNLAALINYWRDEASHGSLSDISEFEAYEALARLLRLAHLADDHWEALTGARASSI